MTESPFPSLASKSKSPVLVNGALLLIATLRRQLIVRLHSCRPTVAALRTDPLYRTVKRVLDIFLCWFLTTFRNKSLRNVVELSVNLPNSHADRSTTRALLGRSHLFRFLFNRIFNRLINNHISFTFLFRICRPPGRFSFLIRANKLNVERPARLFVQQPGFLCRRNFMCKALVVDTW